MKVRNLLLASLAVAAMTACSNENDETCFSNLFLVYCCNSSQNEQYCNSCNCGTYVFNRFNFRANEVVQYDT